VVKIEQPTQAQYGGTFGGRCAGSAAPAPVPVGPSAPHPLALGPLFALLIGVTRNHVAGR
jgi:hypothetical protein